MRTIAEQLNIKEFPFIIYDKNDNELYVEDSSGFWFKCEYDKNGNELYFESSNGFWIKREYNGYKEVYYESASGVIIDNRPKKCTNKVDAIFGRCENLFKIAEKRGLNIPSWFHKFKNYRK